MKLYFLHRPAALIITQNNVNDDNDISSYPQQNTSYDKRARLSSNDTPRAHRTQKSTTIDDIRINNKTACASK